MEKTISVDLKNHLSEMERLRQIVEEFSQKHQLDESTTFALDLVLEEVVTNVIKYGYQDQERQDRIHVDLSLMNGELTIVIRDEGRPFDPTAHPEPDLELPLATRPIGGLGIHLVRNFMDSVEYKRQGNENVLTLKKRVTIQGQ